MEMTDLVTETHGWRTKWRRMWQKKLGPQISNSDLEGLEVGRGGCFVTVASTRTSAPSKCGSYVLGLYLDGINRTSNTRKSVFATAITASWFQKKTNRYVIAAAFLPAFHLSCIYFYCCSCNFWNIHNTVATLLLQVPFNCRFFLNFELNSHC